MKKLTFPLVLILAALFITFFFSGQVSRAESKGKDYGPYQDIHQLELSSKHWCAEEGSDFHAKDKPFIIVDGEKYGPFSLVSQRRCYVAGNNWAFTYTEKTPNGYPAMGIVINGKKYGPFFDRIKSFNLTEKHWGFIYNEDSNDYVNIDGKKYGPFDALNDYNSFGIKFSGDNWGFTYVKDEQVFALINDKQYGPFEKFDNYRTAYLVLSGNNRGLYYKKWAAAQEHIQYQPTNAAPSQPIEEGVYRDREFVMVNDKEYGPFDDTFMPNFAGNNWNFSFTENGKKYVMINDKKYGPFDDVCLYPGNISERHWGFSFQLDNKGYIMLDGQEYGPFDKFSLVGVEDSVTCVPKLTISGEHFGFTYVKDGKNYVMADGKEYGPYSKLGFLNIFENNWIMQTFGNSGGGEDGIYSIYNLNGRELASLDQDGSSGRMTDDHFALAFRKFGLLAYITIDGKEYGPYFDYLWNGNIIFSDSGKWVFAHGLEQTYLVVGGKGIQTKEYGPYKLGGLSDVRLNDKKLGFFYQKNGQYYIHIEDI